MIGAETLLLVQEEIERRPSQVRLKLTLDTCHTGCSMCVVVQRSARQRNDHGNLDGSPHLPEICNPEVMMNICNQVDLRLLSTDSDRLLAGSW